MSYTPTTPTVLLCKNLAAFVLTNWTASTSTPPGSADGSDWDFFRRYGDKDQQSVPNLVGRQVVFFPTHYGWQNETRGLDKYTHHVSCLVVERYADLGISGTNLTVDATTNTLVAPDGYTPRGTDIGYSITVIGGTGFTPGTYEILAISGGKWSLSASPAAVGTSGGTWSSTPTSGDPPRDWTAARADWVHTFIVKGTRFTRSGPPAFDTFVMTLAGDVEVLDVEKLVTQGKLFYSLTELVFEELVS